MAAGAEGDSNLPTSHAGREQVLDALKAAFVQGGSPRTSSTCASARCSAHMRNWMLSPPTSQLG